MALLKASAKKYRQTLVVITHNEEIAQMADRTIMLADGRILSGGMPSDRKKDAKEAAFHAKN